MRPPDNNTAEAAPGPPALASGPLALLLFAAAGAAAYSNVIGAFFLSDDFVLAGGALAGEWSPLWGREHGGFFRPALALSYALDAALWGQRPLGFRLTNVVLHSANSFLVMLLARRLPGGQDAAPARRDAAAFAAGLLFLLHPSHTEAVTWVSGRADLLATLFGLSALLIYSRRAGHGRPAPLALSLVCFALALLAKESAAFIPLAVFLVGARAGGGRGPRHALASGARRAAPFLLVLAAFVAARTAALGALVGGYGADRHLDFSHSTIVSQLLRYPLRAFFPAVILRRLPFLESRLLSPALIAAGAAAVLAAALALSRAGARARLAAFARRNSPLWTPAALFFCSLLPVINLRLEVFTTQGERFLYFPSAFFCVALAYATLGRARRRALGAWVVVLCLLAFYSVSLWATNRNWAEAARLSRSILRDLSAQSAGGAVLVLNAPDNLGGAHLFRNGLPEALRWFAGGRGAADVRVVAWHGLRSPRGGATLSADGAGVLTLTLADEGDAFERVGEGAPDVEVLERGARRLRLRVRAGAGAVDVFYFGGGRMVKVSGEGAAGAAS